MTSSTHLPYAKQSIDESDIADVSAVLLKDMITRSVNVEVFEKTIADYCGAKYAVAFNSGSTALLATSFAAELNAGDRVLTTPNTFISSVSSSMQCGATTVFLDIDLETGSLDLEQLETNLKETPTRGRTVILPVHFAGIAIDMAAIDRMIRDPDTIVIEDAAHALGSCYPTGEKVGSCQWSHMTIFSFHPAKLITTGEGGMVTTNDEKLYKRLRLFRDNCIDRTGSAFEGEKYPGAYDVLELSSNYHLTEFQAVLGLSQFKRMESFIAKRRELTAAYRKRFEGTPHIKMFTDKQDAYTAFHLCVVQIDFSEYRTTRDSVMQKLKQKGIGTQVHYIPIYRHSFLRNKMGDISSYFPITERYFQQALTLPLYYDLKVSDVEYIVQTLKRILQSEQQRPRSNPEAHKPQHHYKKNRRR